MPGRNVIYITKKLLPIATAIPIPKKFTVASEALAFAKSIIQREDRWTQNQLARKQILRIDSDSFLSNSPFAYPACGTKSKQAVAFCALGAVHFVNGPAQKSATAFLREAAKEILISKGVAGDNEGSSDAAIFEVNDGLGHKRTMDMFNMAIRAAKKAEATKV